MFNMKDPITFLINLFGYEKRKPSLLLFTMLETTYAGWVERMTYNGHIEKYKYNLYS